MAGKISKHSEVNAENIVRPSFEQLSAEDQNALDDINKKIIEKNGVRDIISEGSREIMECLQGHGVRI